MSRAVELRAHRGRRVFAAELSADTMEALRLEAVAVDADICPLRGFRRTACAATKLRLLPAKPLFCHCFGMVANLPGIHFVLSRSIRSQKPISSLDLEPNTLKKL